MGCAIGSLLSSVVCCCGSAACSLCCKTCPSMKYSTSTRLSYAFMLICCTILSTIALIPGLGTTLEGLLPGVCSNISYIIINYNQMIDCKSILGYFAVYRICFALACFYFLFMMLMIYVRSSRDPRSMIQNGFWFFKILILAGLLVGAFYIPSGSFEEVFMYFGIVGGFLFILVQLILLIDFVHTWNESWVEKFENERKEYYYGLLIFTAVFFLLAIAIAVLGYVFYASVSFLYCN
jgi:hypothetical protein